MESIRLKQDIENTDFVINGEKKIWNPFHALEWLGFLIDLSVVELWVLASKIEALKPRLQETKEPI